MFTKNQVYVYCKTLPVSKKFAIIDCCHSNQSNNLQIVFYTNYKNQGIPYLSFTSTVNSTVYLILNMEPLSFSRTFPIISTYLY